MGGKVIISETIVFYGYFSFVLFFCKEGKKHLAKVIQNNKNKCFKTKPFKLLSSQSTSQSFRDLTARLLDFNFLFFGIIFKNFKKLSLM